MTVNHSLVRLVCLMLVAVPFAVTTYFIYAQQHSHLPFVDAVVNGTNATCALTYTEGIYGFLCARYYNNTQHCTTGWLARYTYNSVEFTQPEVYFMYPEANGLNLGEFKINDPITCYSLNFSNPNEVVAIQKPRGRFKLPTYLFLVILFGLFTPGFLAAVLILDLPPLVRYVFASISLYFIYFEKRLKERALVDQTKSKQMYGTMA